MTTEIPKDETSIVEFLTKRFPDEQTAVAFFVKKRWGDSIICPYCGSYKVYHITGKQPYKCGDCNTKFTAKTGTIMDGSKIDVRIWLLAMYIMGTARKSISSLQLAKQLGVTQKTAWFMAHRIREACTETGQLSGSVQVDEVYIGGKEKNKRASKRLHNGRGTANKTPVVGLRGSNGRSIARVVKDTSTETLTEIITKNVQVGSAVYTDEHPSYDKLEQLGYKHETVNHSNGEFVRGDATTNGTESLWALFRRGLYGIYHHVDDYHLQRYINEFCFRLEHGGTLPFIDAVCTNVNGNVLRYNELCENRSNSSSL